MAAYLICLVIQARFGTICNVSIVHSWLNHEAIVLPDPQPHHLFAICKMRFN